MLTIGQLADAAGVNVETIRYYERRGLIDAPPRSASGYRQYSSGALWRLTFIARAKALGFRLSEIEQLLLAGASSDSVLAATKDKLREIIDRQAELEELRYRLERLARLCEDGDRDCAALVTPTGRDPREGGAGRAIR